MYTHTYTYVCEVIVCKTISIMILNIFDNLEWRRQHHKILIDVGNSVALEFIESNMKSILIYVTQTSAPGTKGDKSVSWEKP